MQKRSMLQYDSLGLLWFTAYKNYFIIIIIINIITKKVNGGNDENRRETSWMFVH